MTSMWSAGPIGSVASIAAGDVNLWPCGPVWDRRLILGSSLGLGILFPLLSAFGHPENILKERKWLPRSSLAFCPSFLFQSCWRPLDSPHHGYMPVFLWLPQKVWVPLSVREARCWSLQILVCQVPHLILSRVCLVQTGKSPPHTTPPGLREEAGFLWMYLNVTRWTEPIHLSALSCVWRGPVGHMAN